MDEGISIIIPCYNAGKYIQRCLRSIDQGFPNLEVLVINDCSTDDTVQKVQSYSGKLKISIYENEQNIGPGESRNRGVGLASMKYMMFVDADDTLESKFFDGVMPYMSQGYDCITFDAKRVFKNRTVNLPMFISGKGLVKEGDVSRKLSFVFMRDSAYGKLYKSDIIKRNGIRFSSSRRGEEYAFAKAALLKCRKIYYINHAFYRYYDTPGSLMHQEWLESEDWRVSIYDDVKVHINSRKYEDELEAVYFFLVVMPIMMRVIRNGSRIRDVRKKYDELMRGKSRYNKYDKWYEPKFRVFFFALRHRMFRFAGFLLQVRNVGHILRSR